MAGALTPTTVSVLYEPTEADVQSWVNFGNAAWTDYGTDTTILTATTTNPTKGNSTWVARYVQYNRTVHMAMQYVIGSTFSAGSGSYIIQLPVAADTTAPVVGSVLINEAGVAIRVGAVTTVTSTGLYLFFDGGQATSSGLSTSWTTGDYWKASLTYQAA